MQHWLMKTEPDVFGMEDLEKVGVEPWNGVRNYQARNFMREMKVGDAVLIYHSNAKPPGVAGVARVAAAARPDPTQFDPQDDYYDAKSKPEAPRWDLVEVEFVERFARLVPLAEIQADPALAEMVVARRGNRLSITPVTKQEFARVKALGRKAGGGAAD